MVLYCYILAPQTPKSNCSNGAKSIFFLAPLLQCTSINRCAMFMRAKKKIILFYRLIKILYHSLFLTPCLYLSLSHSIWSSHPLPKLSQALILSQSLSSLTVTLSSSLIHRRWLDPAVPSRRSPLCLTGGGGGGGCVGRSASVDSSALVGGSGGFCGGGRG